MSENTVAVATDAAMSYFGLALSENIARRPDTGYVICKDAVIGRTGKQQYLVSSLAPAQLKDLGLDGKYRSHEVVDVWRDSDEVFSAATLASFEDMPLTDNHPLEFVTTKNHRQHSRGHVRNIRRGDSPLSTGDYPILGDLIITDEDLAEDVLQRRKRELSCGYNYHLAYDGQRLSQVGITGNHVAVVPKGRAGAEARINDAAAPRKEYPMMNGKDLLVALGLKQMVTDNADPDKVAEAARAAYATDSVLTVGLAAKDPALEAKDAEIAELKTKLTEALKAKDEKKDDEEEKKDKAEDSLADKLAALDEDDDEEEEKKKKEKAEDADFIQPFGVESVPSDLRAALRELRPLVARSKDEALKAKFNKLAAKANDTVKGTTPENSYGVVKVAAATKSAAANDASADYSARLNARAEARSRGEEVK
jgi:hypothetical protein